MRELKKNDKNENNASQLMVTFLFHKINKFKFATVKRLDLSFFFYFFEYEKYAVLMLFFLQKQMTGMLKKVDRNHYQRDLPVVYIVFFIFFCECLTKEIVMRQ